MSTAARKQGYNMNATNGAQTFTTHHRTNDAHNANSSTFLNAPSDPGGRLIDVSDRLLVCSSSNMRNEVVVGGSDHALYSIDINDPRRKPTTMYSKKCGHTDWVTTVAHLNDGNVLSGSMDGKICMWSASNRSTCVDIQRESTHPVAKIVTDTRYNTAASCCYDGNISLWSFGGNDAYDRNARGPVPVTLSGHAHPVLEIGFRDNILVSGDKGGSLMMWDLNRAEALHRFRAHPGAITAIDVMPDRSTVITCGTDGFVKIWDPRSAGSGLVMKIPAHVKPTTVAAAPSATRASNTTSGAVRKSTLPVGSARPIGGTVYGGGLPPDSTTGRAGVARPLARAGPSSGASSSATAASSAGPTMTASAISCMSTATARGSSDISYIVTGCGGTEGGANSAVVVTDVRAGYRVVSEWNHHRNGVYSLCVAGDECVFSGDGAGNLLCHSLLESQLDRPRDCLRYGVGASAVGAVRSINCLSGKVVTAGEDGKVLVFDYSELSNSNMLYK